MKPSVYIDSREGSGARGAKAVDHIIFDVGRDATVAYISLPISPDDLTPQIEWARKALSSLTEEDVCTAAANKGLIEFEVADIKTGRLFTVKDLAAELLRAVSLGGVIAEHPRDGKFHPVKSTG